MKRAIPIIIALLLFIALLIYIDINKVIEAMKSADLRVLFLAFLISNLTMLLRTLKWKVMLRDVGISELLPVQILGMGISNLTPGKIAEPVKALILKASSGIPVSASLPTIIWERVNDLLVLLCFALLSFFYLRFGMINYFVILLFLLVIALALLVIYNESFGRKVFSLVRKARVRISEDFIRSFYKSRPEPKLVFLSFLLTIIVWLLDGIVFSLALISLGDEANFLAITSLWALSLLLGLASSLPGGIASSDAAMIFLLTSLGTSVAKSAASVLIARAITLGYSLLVGIASFVYLSNKIDKELKRIVKEVFK